jgi:hypothetical protein
LWKSFFVLERLPDFFLAPRTTRKGRADPFAKQGHYAGEVRPSVFHPSTPPEALARQARLEQLLRDMENRALSLEPRCLQEMKAALAGGIVLEMDAWAARVQADHLTEEAAEMVRSSHRDVQDKMLLEQMAAVLTPLAAKAQVKRSAMLHLDSRRTTIRFHFSKQAPALDLEDRDLQSLFLKAFRLEGLIIALDLGKRPRPALRSQLPLPAGAAGLDERMDVELKTEPVDSPEGLLKRLHLRLPQGLVVHQWEAIPNHASELADLAVASHWRWLCPSHLEGGVRKMAANFHPTDHASEGFIRTMAWEDGALAFATRMGPFLATNPIKYLAARLGVNPSEVTGLIRLRVDLRSDARLNQADRFVSKLKNIYEDAVLLGGGSNITLVDEDDDEPLRLG